MIAAVLTGESIRLPLTLFSCVLLMISALLVYTDLKTYARRKAAAANDSDLKTAWKRFRRRIQASAGIGVVGVLFLIAAWINPKTHPIAFASLLLAGIAGTFWIAVLALLDLIGTRRQLLDLKHQQIIQTAILKNELKRAQEKVRQANSLQTNGKHHDDDDA